MVGLGNLVRLEKSDTWWNLPYVCLLYDDRFFYILEKDCLFKMSVPITISNGIRCHLFYETYSLFNILYLISLCFLDQSDDPGQRASAKEQEANLEIRFTELDRRIFGDRGHERDNVV